MNEQPFQDHDRAAGLSPEDQLALDALIERGWLACDGSSNPRDHRLSRLLDLLRPTTEFARADESLIDLTLARVVQVRRLASHTRTGDAVDFDQLQLSTDDQDALEQYVASGFSVASVPAQYRERARRADALLSQLRAFEPSTTERDSLVSRTLDAVQDSVERQQHRMVLDASDAPPVRKFRLGDLISVAALILIGTAVIGPMVGSVRAYGQRLACSAGFGELATAFGQYTGDFRDTLPMATASIAGRPWWNVGNPEESNSANLYTLTRTEYADAARLACPSSDRSRICSKRRGESDWHCIEEVSYSYQNLFARERPRWHEGKSRVAILIDRSPVVLMSARKAKIDPLANSTNHDRAGQNALFNDGSVVWLKSPVLENGDNVWLPRVIERAIADRVCRSRQAEPLRGTESPECGEDTFVGP